MILPSLSAFYYNKSFESEQLNRFLSSQIPSLNPKLNRQPQPLLARVQRRPDGQVKLRPAVSDPEPPTISAVSSPQCILRRAYFSYDGNRTFSSGYSPSQKGIRIGFLSPFLRLSWQQKLSTYINKETTWYTTKETQ